MMDGGSRERADDDDHDDDDEMMMMMRRWMMDDSRRRAEEDRGVEGNFSSPGPGNLNLAGTSLLWSHGAHPGYFEGIQMFKIRKTSFGT